MEYKTEDKEGTAKGKENQERKRQRDNKNK